MCDFCGLINSIDVYLQKADSDLEEIFAEEERASPKESIKEISSLEKDITSILLEETEYITRELGKCKNLNEFLNILEQIKIKDIYNSKISDAVKKMLKRILLDLTKKYVSVIDNELVINTLSKRTKNWIESWSGQLANLMKLSSYNEIENILKKGLQNGYDVETVTRQLMDKGIRNEYFRARRVAVTEMLRAHNVAKHEARMQNPSVTQKMWRHTGYHKNKPRLNHIAMDGQKVPKNEPFKLTGANGGLYYPMIPTDTILPASESVNCHCIAQDIVDNNILALPFEERQRLQQEAIDNMDDEWERELDARNRAGAGIE